MTKLTELLTALFGISSKGVDTSAFKLRLDGDWRRRSTAGPDQYAYYSKKLDVAIKLSSSVLRGLRPGLDRIANALKNERLEHEYKAGKESNSKLALAEPIVIPFSSGYQVAYHGHDNRGRQFRYLGIVAPTKTINIYAESRTRTERELEEIFNDLLNGLSY